MRSVERVVVTGGAGFIGSHLVDRLMADSDFEIVVLDNLRRGRMENLAENRANGRLRLIRGDVRDLRTVTAALEGASVVYHLAAQPTVIGAAQYPHYTFTSNVVGTYNVLRCACERGVRQVLFASSSEIYGEPITLPVDESHPQYATSSFGATKVAGEALCRAFRAEFGLDTAVLRIATVYGSREVGGLISLWIERALAGKDLDVYGGKQVLDFIWVGHVVEAMVRAASLGGALPPTNVASGTGTRLADVAHMILKLTHSSARVRLLPARKADVVRFVANVGRMREILSLEPPSNPLDRLATLLPERELVGS